MISNPLVTLRLEEPSPHQERKILILEDERALEMIFGNVVRSISPRAVVDIVTSGEEALSKLKPSLQEDKRPHDLVIADIFLEGKMTGLDFWNTCQVLCPDTTVLITSSLSVERFFKSVGQNSVAPAFLPKPFTMEECRELISGLLRYKSRYSGGT